MRNTENKLVKDSSKRLPPAQVVKRLFEQQQSETDALRARIAKLEKAIGRLFIGCLIAVFLAAILLAASYLL